MSKVEKPSIALTAQLAQVVHVAVEDGDHASKVIRVALRDGSEKRERRAAATADLRRAIQEGLDRGSLVEHEPLDAMLARNPARLKAVRGG